MAKLANRIKNSEKNKQREIMCLLKGSHELEDYKSRNKTKFRCLRCRSKLTIVPDLDGVWGTYDHQLVPALYGGAG